MYRVSVIIPVRNREKLIESAIRSVLTQTYPVFEIIIVDDGSTDSTPSTVARLAQEDERIHFLQHASSRRAQAARNTGIRAAKGEWIAFLDSDDQWFSDSLEVRLQLAMKKRLRVVHSECTVLRSESTELRRFGVPRMQGQVYKELLRRPGPMFQGLLVSKEALTRINLLDETIVSYQEWDTAIRLAKYYDFGFVPEPTFLYDCRHADTISKDSLGEAKGYEQVFTKHFWTIFRVLGPKVLARNYQEAARLYIVAKDEENARRCSMRAFLLWPFHPRAILRGVRRLLQPGL
jgi:glycosyltransferase involved in cell wall biosynthesis